MHWLSSLKRLTAGRWCLCLNRFRAIYWSIDNLLVTTHQRKWLSLPQQQSVLSSSSDRCELPWAPPRPKFDSWPTWSYVGLVQAPTCTRQRFIAFHAIPQPSHNFPPTLLLCLPSLGWRENDTYSSPVVKHSQSLIPSILTRYLSVCTNC